LRELQEVSLGALAQVKQAVPVCVSKGHTVCESQTDETHRPGKAHGAWDPRSRDACDNGEVLNKWRAVVQMPDFKVKGSATHSSLPMGYNVNAAQSEGQHF
jgi:hypothetical protein